MKKTISLVILSVMLAGLVVPAVAGAQDVLKECCLLSNSVTLKVNGTDTTCDSNTVVAPNAAAAAACTGGSPCAAIASSGDNLTNWGMYCLLNTINSITNWLFYLLLIGVVLAGVIGGALYMTAAGDAEKAGKGKNVILYAIIGLILALVARLVPSVVRLIMGM